MYGVFLWECCLGSCKGCVKFERVVLVVGWFFDGFVVVG